MTRVPLVLLACVALLVQAPAIAAAQAPQRADAPQLWLVSPDPALERALTVALTPWGLKVGSLDEPAPSARMPEAAQRSRDMLARHGGQVVVWTAEEGGASSLWVYDARQSRAFSQPVATTAALDQPAAAAQALSIKALLRHSHLAPETERFGSAPPPGAKASARALYFGISVGARLREVVPFSHEPRLGASLSYMQKVGGAWVGALTEASFGLGVDIREPSLDARLATAGFLVGLAARWPTGPLDLGFAVTSSVRRMVLNGTAHQPTQPVSAVRVNPTLGAWLTAGAELGALRVAGRAGVDAALRAQRYEVDAASAVELSHLAVEIVVTLETRFELGNVVGRAKM